MSDGALTTSSASQNANQGSASEPRGDQDTASGNSASRTRIFEDLVLECVDGKFPINELISKLAAAGATHLEASDYIHQAQQSLAALGRGSQANRERTPEGLSNEERDDFRKNREARAEAARRERDENARRAADELGWQLLRAKVANAVSGGQSGSPISLPDNTSQEIASLLGLGRASASSVPAAILAVAPHIADMVSEPLDEYLEKTWRFRALVGIDRTVDALIDVFQKKHLAEPLARSIWRDIIQDKYVNFEKLYATISSGYDHRDEAKEFFSGFAIIKKDHTNARRPLSSEADWMRVFNAWQAGVCLVYQHRKDELASYCQHVLDLFHSISTPQVVIRFDAEVRERYAKSPFRMDDKSKLDIPFYIQLFKSSPLTQPARRLSSNSFSSSKRPTVPCYNWNFGYCMEPCLNRRRHGFCSECGERHRARDSGDCLASLQAKRGQRFGGSQEDGRGGRTRTQTVLEQRISEA